MRRKLYNQKERFINISDNVGLHIFKDEVGYVDGIYNVTDKQAELVYDFVSTKDFYEILNGTNYVMVYGVGTPEENAAELQAAYNAAKTMPRHIGAFSSGDSIEIYKGQTFVNSAIPIAHVMVANSNYSGAIALAPISTFSRRDSQAELNAALARRVSVIIAPGEYNFGASAFVIDSPSINIVSLTGNSDVIISSTQVYSGNNYGIKVTADNIFVKGINCKTNVFYIATSLDNLICEYCIGGNKSFGHMGITTSGTFNYCTGGDNSFGSTSSGTFNYCTGGYNSFGSYGGVSSGVFNNCVGGKYSFGGTISGKLINCKLTAGTFSTPTGEGKIYNSIDGNGNLINTPLPIFNDNTAAASLAVGTMYRTSTGVQMIKF